MSMCRMSPNELRGRDQRHIPWSTEEDAALNAWDSLGPAILHESFK